MVWAHNNLVVEVAIKTDILRTNATDTSKDPSTAAVQLSKELSAHFTITCKISSESPIALI